MFLSLFIKSFGDKGTWVTAASSLESSGTWTRGRSSISLEANQKDIPETGFPGAYSFAYIIFVEKMCIYNINICI